MIKKATFLQHLEELRECVLRAATAVGIIAAFTFVFGLRTASISGFRIFYPYPDLYENIVTLFFNRLKSDLLPLDIKLIATAPQDAAMSQVQISVFLGIVMGMPFIVYQFGKFKAPGLFPDEKRLLWKISLPATALFLLGCAFAYKLIIPFSFRFLYGYVFAMGAEAYITIPDFVNFVLFLTIAFGLVFELPVLMTGATITNAVDSKFWIENWRYAAVAIFLFAGLITPDGTGTTMLLVAFPMLLLYFAGYLCAKGFERSDNMKLSKNVPGGTEH